MKSGSGDSSYLTSLADGSSAAAHFNSNARSNTSSRVQ
jgi:hypothetical protein